MKWYRRTDRAVFCISASIIVAFIVWATFAGENMGAVMGRLFVFSTNQFGPYYLLIGLFLFVFCVYLAFSKYGNVRLGGDDEKPKFGFWSWFFMLFATGYGVGLVFWGAAEPLSFLADPPFGYAPGSSQANNIALSYAFFHWGWTPWAMYAGLTIPLAYFSFRKGAAPFFSSCLVPIFGEKRIQGMPGKVLDSIMLFGAIGGISTSLGLGIMQLAGGMENVFGIPQTGLVFIVIAALWAGLFTWSAVSGIDRGIKVLSNLNVPLAIFIMAFVFLASAPFFSINLGTNALGMYIDSFFRMSLNTDPIDRGGFPQNWTVFYWAWWFSAAPATALFVARISSGRTIRQVILTMMGAAPLATWLWFTSMGGAAFDLQFNRGVDLLGFMSEMGPAAIVFEMLGYLPLGSVIAVLFLVLIILFLATTADSFSYVCAQISTKKDCDPLNPAKGLRAFWAVMIVATALLLLLYGEGITALQTASIITALLVAAVSVLLCIAMLKSLKAEAAGKQD